VDANGTARDGAHAAAQAAVRVELPSVPRKLRVGVIGAGYWGPNLIRNFAALEGCALGAVCDADPARLAPIGRGHPGVRLEREPRALLEDPALDALAICTPVHTHHPLARAALAAGKHVLVEKPMAHSLAAARELVELAAAEQRVLMVDHTFVYSGPIRKMRALIESGEIGELLYFDSVRINLGLFQKDVNVLWDLAPHDLSIMDHLLQREPRWVSAIGTTHFGELENLAYVTVRFDGSLIAHFHVNWLAPVKIRRTVIGGSKKMIVYDDLDPSDRVKIYDKGVSINADRAERDRMLIDYRTGDMHAPRIDKTEPLAEVCAHFVECARHGRRPATDGEAGLRIVRLLEAAQQSIARDGARVAL
jgi:predicted dehydrogenase